MYNSDNRIVITLDAGAPTLFSAPCKAADILKEKGAKSVRAVATHAVLSGKAYENIEKSALDEVVFTDSIPQRQECSKIRVISVADLFAETIRNVVEHRSISEHFIL